MTGESDTPRDAAAARADQVRWLQDEVTMLSTSARTVLLWRVCADAPDVVERVLRDARDLVGRAARAAVLERFSDPHGPEDDPTPPSSS